MGSVKNLRRRRGNDSAAKMVQRLARLGLDEQLPVKGAGHSGPATRLSVRFWRAPLNQPESKEGCQTQVLEQPSATTWGDVKY